MSNSNSTTNLGNRRAYPSASVIAALTANGLPESIGPQNPLPVTTPTIPGAAIPANDTIVKTPLNAETAGGTVTYYAGGTGGTIVAQLTYAVSGGNLTITRSV